MTARSRCLLVVDANAADVEITRRCVAVIAPDLILRTAIHGEDALNVLCGGLRPDLILLDLTMPAMDGVEFLKAVGGFDCLRHIPVVVYAGRDDLITEAYRAGASGYVVKPQGLPEAKGVLERVLSYWLGVVALPGQGPDVVCCPPECSRRKA